VTTSKAGTSARLSEDVGLRVRWFAVGVPVYTVGAALAQVLGEVVGEAWGGAFLHLFGHAIGTVLHVWLLVVAAWLVLRGRVAWAKPWAIAGAVGSLIGLVLYLPLLSLATTPEELIIAFSLYLPLTAAAVAQSRVLRGHVQEPGRWAASWFFAIVFGVGPRGSQEAVWRARRPDRRIPYSTRPSLIGGA
jgi:hypothetical protein